MIRLFKILSSLCMMAVFSAGSVTGQSYSIYDLDGTWQFRKQGTKAVYNGIVPGCIHTDLMRNNLIPDPFLGANESQVQWVSDTGWVYEKFFTLNTDFFEPRNIDLVFEGLDTYANVYLNDSLILVADNMFKQWYVPIKYILKIGINKIRIEFPSVTKENKARYSGLKYKLPGDERTVCRKAAYHFGWDWGPTLTTSGIWRSVYIRSWNYVNVLGVRVVQKKLTDIAANMSAVFTINSKLGDSAEFRLIQDTTVFFKGKEVLEKGMNVIRVDFDIPKPIRWWPNGLGTPFLYNVGFEVWFAGKKVYEGSKKIGLRTVELVQEPDSIGKSFYFKINGKTTYVRGANYIPQDIFPSRVTDSTYRALISDVKEANMNMLRVWGGGIYEKDLFYDLCDENGIMVWQDFMFANAMLPSSQHFISSIRDEVIQNLVRLRDHPSIVLWCGNNEIDEGWKNWGWVKQYGYSKEDSFEVYKTYKAIFNELIPNTIKKHDTLRPYIATSPKHGWGREQSYKEGDSHYWGVWWGKEPFSKYDEKIGRFMSEYGFQSFPDISTIRKFTKPDDRVAGSKVMKAHQKHPVGYETIDEYLERDFRKPKDFEMLAYVSQLVQAEGMRIAIEAHRRAKPYCMGTMYWQLNDCWPVVSWSARDYYGTRKALYYRTRELFRNNLLAPRIEGDSLKVYAISDEPGFQGVYAKSILYDFDGTVLYEKEVWSPLLIAKNVVHLDTALSEFMAGKDPARTVLYTQIRNPNGFLTSNLFYFTAPKDLKLEKPTITISATEVEGGYELEVNTTKLARFVKLSSDIKGTFSDNYFDLVPGVPKKVRFATTVKTANLNEKITTLSLVDSYQQ